MQEWNFAIAVHADGIALLSMILLNSIVPDDIQNGQWNLKALSVLGVYPHIRLSFKYNLNRKN